MLLLFDLGSFWPVNIAFAVYSCIARRAQNSTLFHFFISFQLNFRLSATDLVDLLIFFMIFHVFKLFHSENIATFAIFRYLGSRFC